MKNRTLLIAITGLLAGAAAYITTQPPQDWRGRWPEAYGDALAYDWWRAQDDPDLAIPMRRVAVRPVLDRALTRDGLRPRLAP